MQRFYLVLLACLTLYGCGGEDSDIAAAVSGTHVAAVAMTPANGTGTDASTSNGITGTPERTEPTSSSVQTSAPGSAQSVSGSINRQAPEIAPAGVLTSAASAPYAAQQIVSTQASTTDSTRPSTGPTVAPTSMPVSVATSTSAPSAATAPSVSKAPVITAPTVSQISINGYTLSWTPPALNADGTPFADLAGYRVSYGTNARALTETTSIANSNADSYAIPNLSSGTWYFSVAAYNSAGVTGNASTVVEITL